MHRSVSGHFGLRLFISEPINVSTWHQIRLGPLTSRHQSSTLGTWKTLGHNIFSFATVLSTTNLFTKKMWSHPFNSLHKRPSRGWR